MSVKEKLTSRKFWFSVAAFLSSIATSIVALNLGNDIIAAIGLICAVLSAAIYSACEASVDCAYESGDLYLGFDDEEDPKESEDVKED